MKNAESYLRAVRRGLADAPAEDRERLTGYLKSLIAGADEEALRAYRVTLKHL